MRWPSIWLIPAIAITVSACATRPPIPPETGPQAFIVERDLAGQTSGRGEFRAITGVKRGFSVALQGTWDGKTLTLVEDFAYDDGEKDRKTWSLQQVAPGRFVGTREDVIGQALGFQDGRGFRLEYTMQLKDKQGRLGRKVKFRDILVLTGDGAVLNRANVGLWGLRVATVELRITRTQVN